MAKFLVAHTMHGITKEMLEPMGRASQKEKDIKGIRSYTSKSMGKIFCEFDAKDEKTLEAWLKKMNMPYDSIMKVELYGEYGTIKEV